MIKICIFSGNRAEYGLLSPIIKNLNESKKIKVFFIIFYVKSLSQYLPKDVSINILSPGNLLFPNSVWDKKLKNNKKATIKLIKTKF